MWQKIKIYSCMGNTILILDKGKTILQGNLKEIKDSYKANRVELITKADVSKEIKDEGLIIIKELDNRYEIAINDELQAQNLLKKLVSKNIEIEKMEVKKPSLNDIFIEKVGDK